MNCVIMVDFGNKGFARSGKGLPEDVSQKYLNETNGNGTEMKKKKKFT